MTSVFVTHDQEEALDVADRVVILNQGRIEQQGTPEEVYEKPRNAFVYDFLGNVNLFRGRLNQGQVQLGSISVAAPEYAATEETAVVSYVRPHNLQIERTAQEPNFFQARILYLRAVGPTVFLELQREDTKELVEAELTQERYRELKLQQGEQVYVKPKDLKIFLDDYCI